MSEWEKMIEMLILIWFIFWKKSIRGLSKLGKNKFCRRHPNQSSLRRSVRTSQRSADSGFDPCSDTGLTHSYSDNDCRWATFNACLCIHVASVYHLQI